MRAVRHDRTTGAKATEVRGADMGTDAKVGSSEAADLRLLEERRQGFLEASERIGRALKALGVAEQDFEPGIAEWREARR